MIVIDHSLARLLILRTGIKVVVFELILFLYLPKRISTLAKLYSARRNTW